MVARQIVWDEVASAWRERAEEDAASTPTVPAGPPEPLPPLAKQYSTEDLPESAVEHLRAYSKAKADAIRIWAEVLGARNSPANSELRKLEGEFFVTRGQVDSQLHASSWIERLRMASELQETRDMRELEENFRQAIVRVRESRRALDACVESFASE